MELYNIMDEIARRQLTKTELGDNRMHGVTIGIVAKKYNKEMAGRVCVQIPVRDEEANILKWARIAMPLAGKKWGAFFQPEIGDQVLLAFEEGNIDKPYIIGCIHGDSGSFLGKYTDVDNQYKVIKTKNGNMILFEDNREGEGEKDKISIETAKSACRFSLDNENQKMQWSDKDKKNIIEMNMQSGGISVRAEKKLTIEIGDVKIKIDGEKGKISVDCKNLNVKAGNSIKMQSDSTASLKGGNTIVEGSSHLKLSSGNAAVLEGAFIKLG